MQLSRKTIGVFFSLAVCCTCAATLHAQTTWHVDGTNCRPNNALGTELRPFCDLRIAITNANDGDTILVMDGLYTGIGNSVLAVSEEITIRSQNGADATILDCDGSYVGIEFFAPAGKFPVLEGFTITRAGGGGCIAAYDSHPIIRSCVFTNSTFGPGVILSNSDAVFTNCRIEGHSHSQQSKGAGVYANGGSPKFIDCVIANNTLAYMDPATAISNIRLRDVRSFVNATSLAYHPANNRYYGSIWHPNEEFDFQVYSHRADTGAKINELFFFPIAPRAWFYNPNTDTVEVVSNTGRLYAIELDGVDLTSNADHMLSLAAGLPGVNSVPAYDPVGNVLYARAEDNIVHVVDHEDGSLIRTFALQDVPTLTSFTIGYNPTTRHILTTEANGTEVFIHDIEGNLLGTDEIGKTAPAAHGVGFARNLLFVFDEDDDVNPGFGAWYTYRIRGESATERAGSGAGLCIVDANVLCLNCVIAGNSTQVQGGGLLLHNSTANMINCLIADNSAIDGAGIASMRNSSVTITNTTFAGNNALGMGGAVFAQGTDNLVINNSILWQNAGGEIDLDFYTNIAVNYSDVMGGWPSGTGNLDADPLFSVFDPNDSWTVNRYQLSTNSPCSDAGDNASVPADSEDLDGDGDFLEPVPMDLDGTSRFVDNEEVQDGGGDVVDMGAYELLPFCVGDKLIPPANIPNVDYEATVLESDGIVPAEAAFYHACVDNNGQCEGAIFAGEGGAEVTVKWKYRQNPGDHTLKMQAMTYRIGRCAKEDLGAAQGYYVTRVKYFKAYPEANVVVNDQYVATLHYNSIIKDNTAADEPADAEILPNGQFAVTGNCPDGMVVIAYSQFLGGPLLGLEVLTITSEGAVEFDGPLPGGAMPIGRRLQQPAQWDCACEGETCNGGGNDGQACSSDNDCACTKPCRAILVRNSERNDVAVAWQRGVDTTDIYPIRPESDSFAFLVGWYDETPLANCWPVSVLRYHTNWPTDPQLHVVDEDAAQGAIPAGSLVDLRSNVYCGAEIMYQQGFGGGTPPIAHITAGKFAARSSGYSVLRLDKQPDEISACGDEVFFEVVESYDRKHASVLAPGDTDVSWDIASQLECTGNNCGCESDCDNYFDDQALTYPFGFLFIPHVENERKPSLPYAVEIHRETGQIFPVNTSAEHGMIEAWWYEQGAYAESVYWPNKVVTYRAAWPMPNRTAGLNDDKIVIAARKGAGSYPEGARIYEVGAIGDDEFSTPGWNPNDEHAILLPVAGSLRAFAVRSDNPWQTQTGHAHTLVQYRDEADETLWKMGVHAVFAEDLPNNIDLIYDTHRLTDENCGTCNNESLCEGGGTTGYEVACATDEDCCEIPVLAGLPVDPLFPVNFGAAVCFDEDEVPLTRVEPLTGDALWVDRKGGIWAVEECNDTGDDSSCDPTSSALIYLFENWSADCGCQPWLVNGPNADGGHSCDEDSLPDPWPIEYRPSWPAVDPNPGAKEETDPCQYPDDPTCAPLRHIGQTFDQSGQCGSIEILHDGVGVRIIDPTFEVSELLEDQGFDALLGKLPPHLHGGMIAGGSDLEDRIYYDYGTAALVFRGVMSVRDKEELDRLSNDSAYMTAVDNLYAKSRVQIGDNGNIGFCEAGPLDGMPCQNNNGCMPEGVCVAFLPTSGKSISLADPAATEGWLTLAYQNDQDCVDQGLPVSVAVWRVECPPDQGRIEVIYPKCPLSEKVTLRFSGDGGGYPENLIFQWQWSLDPDDPGQWQVYEPPTEYANGTGLREILIEGAGKFTLQDTYWRVRYRGYAGCPCNGDCNEGADLWPVFLADDSTKISPWTSTQLSEGWVKRVIRGINPFDQRVEEFHKNDAATYVDMIRQAGHRFVEPVPSNCDPENIDGVGLIELYETVLLRARAFGLEGADPATSGIIKALLLVAGKIADLNMLLGNEAFADSLDPTVGVFADDGDPSGGYDPHAVFCFEEQVATFLEEELALLRGTGIYRDIDRDSETDAIIATVDNRLPWNFTSGNGQVAYANNYQMLDITEAVTTYPQGHGDAWGYYLTAMSKFYGLLSHANFDWLVLTEDVQVNGQPVEVGFMYERKFAAAAAAKARAGAAITSLTFRQRSSFDPIDPQKGYPDVITARAWGLADWGRRAGQGAYFDWLMANAMLPSEDPLNEGIQKIDRTTVLELREIAAANTEIQTILDKADAGLNPLGLAANVVPFGLDPKDLEEGITHFDQMARHALVTLNNATTAFDFANANTQRLRSMQNNVDTFEDLVEQTELDHTARLIEVFGRPYAEDVGGGGAYPEGYNGPDIFHFAYMDPSDLLNRSEVNESLSTGTTTISAHFHVPNFAELDLGALDLIVKFNVSTDGLGLIRPLGWSRRPEPGEIQFARRELVQTAGQYMQALESYEATLDQIDDQAQLLRDLFDLNEDVLGVMVEDREDQMKLNGLIAQFRQVQNTARSKASITLALHNAIAEAIPTNFGFANDVAAPARSVIRLVGVVFSELFIVEGNQAALSELRAQHAKESISLGQPITITGLQNEYQELQQVVALKQLIRSLLTLQIQMLTQDEAIQQAAGRYHSAIGRGLRLLEQRTAFRRRTANQITKYRYRDMAFRVFRNDALQKYRAQFDLAARYVLLAAKAYDYETNLLGDDPMGGRRFMEEIVKERSLGVIIDGQPYIGNGLAGRLAGMMANFDVLRSELGFNNEDRFRRTFSLRTEHFGIDDLGPAGNAQWQAMLNASFIPDLNEHDVYRQYCQPLLTSGDHLDPIPDPNALEPAIVIPFRTTLASRLNLFGYPSRGDEILPPDRFAIKIHSFQVELGSNYASPPLNKEIHVYLVPTGSDVMRVPTDGSVREWNVLDQVLPVPFPVSMAELQQPDWMPWDTLIGGSSSMAYRRRIATVTACSSLEPECDMNNRLLGRSIWNTQWFLIIPGSQLLGDDPDEGIDLFINGENGTGVRDIKLTFELYGYTGSLQVGG